MSIDEYQNPGFSLPENPSPFGTVIIEWFGLEATFKGHVVQLSFNKQEHFQLDEVAQSPVQPSPGCFQGWDIHHLSGQPVPVFHYPHWGKKKNLYI